MWEREALGEFYVSLLQDRLGLRATVDDDHDVAFHVAGNQMWIMNHGPQDPSYFRVVFGTRFGPSTPDALLAACLKANGDWKGVKVNTLNGVVELSYEAFEEAGGCRPDPAHLEKVLPRVVGVLLEAAESIAQDLAA